MNHPFGIGNGKRGPGSRRTDGRTDGSNASSTLRGMPADGAAPTGPRPAASLVRTSVMADPLWSRPGVAPPGFRTYYQNHCQSGCQGAARRARRGGRIS